MTDANSNNLPPPPVDGGQWLMLIDAQTYGPYTLEKLREFVHDGRLTVQTPVRPVDDETWLAAGQRPALQALFGDRKTGPVVDFIDYSATGPMMSFGEAIHTCVKLKYATFQGRASRAEFWWFQLFIFGISTVFFFIGGFLNAAAEAPAQANLFVGLLTIVMLLVMLGLLLPSLAVSVRRLHDLGWSGWWLLANFIPLVEFIMVICFMMRGAIGPNKYGADPVARVTQFRA